MHAALPPSETGRLAKVSRVFGIALACVGGLCLVGALFFGVMFGIGMVYDTSVSSLDYEGVVGGLFNVLMLGMVFLPFSLLPAALVVVGILTVKRKHLAATIVSVLPCFLCAHAYLAPRSDGSEMFGGFNDMFLNALSLPLFFHLLVVAVSLALLIAARMVANERS